MSDLKRRILSAVQDDLAAIETALAENLHPHFDLVRQVAGHLLFAGGKRLRPLLMLLAARLCGYQGPDGMRYAVIFEYLHAATLLHDDVVDGGELRRGRPAAHQVWDPPTAVLAGDFLLARSLSLAAASGRPEVIGTIADITEMMSQGEIQQLWRKGDLSLIETDYMEVIRCKTAVLFQGACRTGALLTDAPKDKAQALADYGLHLGLAFQMADDLLDYTQDAATLGKKPGADLRESKLTLPVIYALGRATDEDAKWMKAMVGQTDFSKAQFNRLVKALEDYGGIAYTRKAAGAQIAVAKAALRIFEACKESDLLNDIADYALQRAA
jgi:octaprenyl-diphosphate synthase